MALLELNEIRASKNGMSMFEGFAFFQQLIWDRD